MGKHSDSDKLRLLLEKKVNELENRIEDSPIKENTTIIKEVGTPERDGKYDEFIMEELKRLNTKVVAEHTELDARIVALE